MRLGQCWLLLPIFRSRALTLSYRDRAKIEILSDLSERGQLLDKIVARSLSALMLKTRLR